MAPLCLCNAPPESHNFLFQYLDFLVQGLVFPPEVSSRTKTLYRCMPCVRRHATCHLLLYRSKRTHVSLSICGSELTTYQSSTTIADRLAEPSRHPHELKRVCTFILLRPSAFILTVGVAAISSYWRHRNRHSAICMHGADPSIDVYMTRGMSYVAGVA